MPELNIQFFDVGQGDGIFITFPNDKTMLVDLGSNKNSKLTSADIITYFRNHTKFKKPNQVLDYLVLTHGDGDHFNIVQKFRDTLKPTIGNLLFGGKEKDYRGLIGKLQTSQRGDGKPRINVLSPVGIFPFPLAKTDYFGGVSLEVLGMNVPGTYKRTAAWRKNTGSVVLRMEYGGVGVLLTGDATIETEKYILKTLTKPDRLEKLKSTILKVGHHGSARTSISPKWIEAIKPEYIFISSDRSGALSEKSKTGHRLPQQLAIDIINANTELAEAEKHHYVSSYDPEDYTKYKAPDTRAAFANPHTGAWAAKKCWKEFETRKAIFTTLVAMDRKSVDGTAADQGAQYGLTITDKGDISIATTDEDEDE